MDGQGTKRSDLHYKEKILGSSQQKFEPRNKDLSVEKDKGVPEKKNRPTNAF